MTEQTHQPEHPKTRLQGRVAVVYWLLAGLGYALVGILYPPAFLLGFQESVIVVYVVTALAPVVIRRFR
jgi:hypothetical protein